LVVLHDFAKVLQSVVGAQKAGRGEVSPTVQPDSPARFGRVKSAEQSRRKDGVWRGFSVELFG